MSTLGRLNDHVMLIWALRENEAKQLIIYT